MNVVTLYRHTKNMTFKKFKAYFNVAPRKMNNLDCIVITNKKHEVVACVSIIDNDGMIINNGYNIYKCEKEPFFDDVGSEIYYNPGEKIKTE